MNMKINIDDKFWNERIAIVQNVMLPFQWRVLNDEEPDAPKSGAIMNFKIAAGEAEGEFHGMVFQDTDLHKWLEAVAYSLELKPNPQLQEWGDEAVRLIAKAQMADGYVDTYFQVFRPDLQWTDLTDNHELYTFGHLIEGGVAYYQATGNQTIYEVITKLGDLLVSRFGLGKPTTGLPGHPEIELALLRLYDLTQKKAYLELAKYFVLERGAKPNFFIEEPKARRAKGIPSWLDIIWNNGFVKPEHEDDEDVSYYVASKRLVDQLVVEGHAVRACYLYSALADIAHVQQDQKLKAAAQRLFDNAVTKQMYITGGIGQTNMNEGFTHDYDLPNESNYCETCAGISLIYWSQRMLKMEVDSKYADVIERTLYNNTLGSMSLDAKAFYYRNELERWGKNIARAGRPKWHACACCPPNLARLILSLKEYIAHQDADTEILYIHQLMGAEIQTDKGTVTLAGNMPWGETMTLTFQEVTKDFRFGIRLPEWSLTYQLQLNGKTLYEGVDFTINRGYILPSVELKSGDSLTYTLDFQPKVVYGNTLIKQDAGKAAITRGPLVYCLEEEDNGHHLWQLSVAAKAGFREEETDELKGIVRLFGDGLRDVNTQHGLYSYSEPFKRSQVISAIPYYTRYNRSVGELQVWHRTCDCGHH
jgi:DUF1680 family protein